MRYVFGIILIILSLVGCDESDLSTKKIETEKENIRTKSTILDSIQVLCKINQADTFSMTNLQTDSFKGMVPVSKEVYKILYQKDNGYRPDFIFIMSVIESSSDFRNIITYQKDFGGDKRIDFIDLIVLDSLGVVLEKIRLAASDNEVITYEVSSILESNNLKTTELLSSEPYFDPNLDTLYTTICNYKIGGKLGIEKLKCEETSEERSW